MPNKLSVTAGERQEKNHCSVRYSISRYLITELDIPGVQTQTHTLATGPVNDLELALFPDEHGDLSIEILANKQRYDEPTLIQHAERLKMLIASSPRIRRCCAAMSILCCQVSMRSCAQINATQVEIPETTLSALVAEQAAKTPDAPALADARYLFSYREMREQVVALANLLRERGVKQGRRVAVALPRSVFLTLALHAIVEAGLATAGYRLSGRSPENDAGRCASVAVNYHRRSTAAL
ncbi:AMP-binding protein [Escherichia coli]